MASWREAFEAIYQGILDARDDIRHKVVEEGWFGKQVTGDVEPFDRAQREATAQDKVFDAQWEPVTSVSPPEFKPLDFDKQWAIEDRSKGVEPPDRDQGIDR